MTGFLDITEADYHADMCERPSLSASIAKRIVSESPYHAWLRHPRLGNQPSEPSKAMETGTLIHALVLGTPLNMSVVNADNYRTKAAQEQREEAHAKGLTPILAREIDDIQAVAFSITALLHAEGIDLTGQSEVVAVWEEDTPDGPVLCRGRMDHLIRERGLIFDLKTTASAHPDKCAKACIEYGYDIQCAAYTSAIHKLVPEVAGRESFTWLFVETLPVGSPRRAILTVAQPDGAMRELGRARWESACATWARCLASDVWPAYSVGVASLTPPAWAMRETFEMGAA